MELKVKEVSDLVGISVRTLHYYDEIGLLKPTKTTELGYRLYTEDNLETLQQILFFRELGFPLKKINQIINSPSFDKYEALLLHRKMLIEKRNRINNIITTIDKTTQHLKGEIHMSNKEKFAGFDFSKNIYEQEARKRWGNEAVDKSTAKINSMTSGEQQVMGEKMNTIYKKLAKFRNKAPNSIEAQAAIKDWFDFLNNNTGHKYSLEAFKGLGQMYVADERFTKNIDQFGEGLAKFMCNAMAVFADQNEDL